MKYIFTNLPAMKWSARIVQFYQQLEITNQLPARVSVLQPFGDEEVKKVFNTFYEKFYGDSKARHAIIGINPGRFGGGVTGIPFTDPIRLQNACGISNHFAARQELSSVFMYDMINAYGGPEKFYQQFYITSYSPLGFVANGKNLNYYDDKALTAAIESFAVDCMRKQISWGLHTGIAFCLGDGKNYTFLSKLNKQHHFFDKIIPLPHPRFIMQYKLKQKQEYIDKYLSAFYSI